LEDIRAVAAPVLRHRVIVNYAAVSEGISSESVTEHLLKEIPPPGEK